jgi:iron complex outermembrane receptor protein
MPFSIPAQPLEDALNEFIAVTDWQVGFPAELAKGARSPGVAGRYPPSEALRKLLAGTGLVHRHTGARAVTLERAPEPIRPAMADNQEVHLSPVMVKDEALEETDRGSYTVAPAASPPPRPTRPSWTRRFRYRWYPARSCRINKPRA